MFARVMESIWIVLFLHNLRFQALSRHLWSEWMLRSAGSSAETLHYAAKDLRRGRDIADELAPVDLVVARMYQRWMQERGYPGIGHGMHSDWVVNVGALCLRIMSTLPQRVKYVSSCHRVLNYTHSLEEKAARTGKSSTKNCADLPLTKCWLSCSARST